MAATGELSTFVLLQALLADDTLGVPVWAAGGIGPHTAAAAVAGGAAGVVVDTQLALLPEAELPSALTTAVTGLDGSETDRRRRHPRAVPPRGGRERADRKPGRTSSSPPGSATAGAR